jgi:signal transduction histidine kinase/CheY-like chemotaxis protein/HPt (histidine-containing phosphotransfer) domain-containing protein
MKGKLKKYTKSIIIISSLISICLVLFIAFSANYYISRMSKNNAELYSAYRISELMKSFKSNINVLESKQRGYIVTGDPKFLEAYKLKESETKTYLKSMEKYFSGKPEEEAFYKLKELTYKKLMEAKDLNGNINAIGIPGGNNNTQDIGVNTITEITNTVNDINDSLSKTTKILLDNSVAYVDASKSWSYLEIALAILTAIAAVIILITDINTRNKLEDDLRIAKKQADENAVMKEQFMANMSHEIRTPMNSILGFSDLLQKTNLDKTQVEYLMAVKASGSNLLNIVNDILDFSKIEAGKLHIEKISFNLLEVFESMKVMFIPKALEKQITFTIHIDKAAPLFVFGDPTRLAQILINLINNAIKFTVQGEVTLSCEIKAIEHDIVQFVFKVKDTGIGIPADKLESVFERFNQGNTETTRRFGGNGLGLAIVKQLVEIQNGDISLKSKEGIGSEFTVRMSYPISYENKHATIEQTTTPLKIISNKPISILLVEDHQLNQKLASTYLIHFGLEVDLAENGIEAINKLKNKHFDLVLMDIQMPILDGYHASKKIREELKNSVPIIAMTANIMPHEKEKCLSYGMNDYLSKPFKEVDLYNMLIAHLGNKVKSNHTPFLVNTNLSIPITTHYKIISTAHLESLSRGNSPFIKEIVTIFLEQNPIEIKELEQAIILEDFNNIRSISHKMKTSVGFIGLEQLLNPLNQIETLAIENGNVVNIQPLYDHIKIICEEAICELTLFIKE